MTNGAYSVAIIGMSGSFPGAANVDQLWQAVRDGKVLSQRIDESQLRAAGVPAAVYRDPHYVPVQALPPHVDCFDAEFFGVAPGDAISMDPQHRLLLEHSYSALESAGYAPGAVPGLVGVFVGVGLNSYLLHYRDQLMNSETDARASGNARALLGNEKSYAATRIAYRLNLRGPCFSVDSACSTSLVALHLACTSLISGECDMALAGGARIAIPLDNGFVAEPGGIHAPDGQCAPFDARAHGTIPASGVGIVVLKRLEDAIRDRDPISAVVLSTAINNDGSAKIDFAAPSIDGQTNVISAALAAAGVDAGDIQYVETHGTGTAIGDPLELAALDQVFASARNTRRERCWLGSAKANVGHLDVAAGVTGLIKATCALAAKEIPPLANFERPNPRIDFDRSAFAVPTVRQTWPTPKAMSPRLASVSSFGIGGTNAHAILAEAPDNPSIPSLRAWHLLPLSARNDQRLVEHSKATATFLDAHPRSIDDVAYTLQCGREAMRTRAFLISQSTADAAATLANGAATLAASAAIVPAEKPRIVFLFPEQSASHGGAALSLYKSLPLFKANVDACSVHAGEHVRAHLLAASGTGSGASEVGAEEEQVSLFVFQYSLARTFMDMDVRPDAVIGNNLGEYVAACVAGVMSSEAAIRLIRVRALAMSAVGAVGSNLSANRSPLIDAAIAPFAEALAGVALQPPTIRFASSVDGACMKSELADSSYWLRQLCESKQFQSGLSALCYESQPLLIEVGLGNALSTLARAQRSSKAERILTLQPQVVDEGQSSLYFFWQCLGRLWQYGCNPRWQSLYGQEERHRVRLPSYPFARTRFWPAAIEPAATDLRAVQPNDAVRGFEPTWWRDSIPKISAVDPNTRWVLFSGDRELTQALHDVLIERDADVVIVNPNPNAAASREHRADFVLSDLSAASLTELWRSIVPERAIRPAVRAIWLASPASSDDWQVRYQGTFLPLLTMAQGAYDLGLEVRVDIVTSQLFRVLGNEAIQPSDALLVGAARVLPQEYSGMCVRIVDLPICADGARRELVTQLADELTARIDAPPIVAIRHGARWTETFRPLEANTATLDVREDATYVVLGGTGAIGRRIAEQLAARARIRLILVGRLRLPPRHLWEQLSEGSSSLAELLRDIQRIERNGSSVEAHQIDLRDCAALEELLRTLGPIAGIVHAAGVPSLGLARFKSVVAMHDVLATKIQPLLAIERAIKIEKLDFLLLCSSMTSIVGGPGQAEYAAANAYLDHFAESRRGRARVLSVAWDRWDGIGMAGNVDVETRRRSRLWDTSANGPSWSHALQPNSSRERQEFRLQIERDWCLREHAIAGRARLPGMAFVDMLATAAFARGNRAIAIRDVEWLASATADEGGGIDLALDMSGLNARGGAVALFANSGKAALQFARARIESSDATPPSNETLDRIRARCSEIVLRAGADFRGTLFPGLDDSVISLGSRWNALREILGGNGELLAQVELAADHIGDLHSHGAHPAMLDTLLLAGSLLARRDDNARADNAKLLIPAGIESVRLQSAIPAKVYGWLRLVRHSTDELVFDTTLFDAAGASIGVLNGVRLRASGALDALLATSRPGHTSAATAGTSLEYAGLQASEALQMLPMLLRGSAAVAVVTRNDIESVRALLNASSAKTHSQGSQHSLEVTGESVTSLQRTIADMWAHELGLSKVDVDDNFFELGGTSLSAMQVVNAIRQRCECELPARALFDFPTLRALAEEVARSQSSSAPAASRIVRVSRAQSLPLSQAQRALSFLDSVQDDAATYNVPVIFAVDGALRLQQMLDSLAQLVDRHEPLRTRFELEGAELKQRILERLAVAVPVVDISALPANRQILERDRILEWTARARFKWVDSRLCRISILRIDDRQHVVAACLHHAICDHWSVGVFVGDWLRLYDARAPLAPLELQYADVLAHQQTAEHAARVRDDIAYWRGKLADAPLHVSLPADFERSDTPSNQGATELSFLPRSLLSALEKVAIKNSATLYVVLLAAFKMVLHKLTAARRIVVGSPTANRPDERLRSTIGFFANTVAFYSHVNPDESVGDLLQQVRDTTLEAFDHQAASFDQIVDALGRAGSVKYSPLFQVVFALQNAPWPSMDFGDLTLRSIEAQTSTAKFDVTCMLYEEADGLRVEAEYRTDLFKADTIRRLLSRYVHVLERMATDDLGQSVSKLLSREGGKEDAIAGTEELLL